MVAVDFLLTIHMTVERPSACELSEALEECSSIVQQNRHCRPAVSI